MADKGPKALVTIHSQKGGTGKTTVALLLQRYLAQYAAPRASCVLLDLDLTGTAPADALSRARIRQVVINGSNGLT